MISLNKVNKQYDTFSLNDISFEVSKGEYLVVLGPSGAGKTVILELIAGLIKPDQGEIKGTDFSKVGFIYQDYMLFPHLNVFDNIAYGLKIRKSSKQDIAISVLKIAEKLKIKHLLERDVETLSGGEKQRVAIARALVIEPEVVLLDEPTSALDVHKRSKVQRMFLDLHKEIGATFIHVTHNYEEALSVADRIVVINEGEIQQIGKTEDIFHSPNNKFIADFVGYRNVYHGDIKDKTFTTAGIEVYLSHLDVEGVYIAIKSDDIIVSKKKIESSARNSFKGKIISARKKPSFVELVVDCGIEIQADITAKSYEELALADGSEVWLTFKSSAILVFEH